MGLLLGVVGIPEVGGFPGSVGVPLPFTLGDAVGLLAVGHPVTLLRPVAQGAAEFESALTAGLPAFLAFHAAVALAFFLSACGRLRLAEVWSKQPARVVAPRPPGRAGPRGDARDTRSPPARPPCGRR